LKRGGGVPTTSLILARKEDCCGINLPKSAEQLRRPVKKKRRSPGLRLKKEYHFLEP